MPRGQLFAHSGLRHVRGAQVLLCRTFRAAVQAVISGRADACVLPIENTLNGGVLQNMDMLQAEDGLTAVAEYTLPIDHRLITLAGADKSRIERIYSHRQALDQCAGFLQEHYPDAELVPERSTAASVDCIKTPREAAIAGVQCAREGLDVSPECISDEKNNFTHFLLVTKGQPARRFQKQQGIFRARVQPCAGRAHAGACHNLRLQPQHDQDRVAPHQK